MINTLEQLLEYVEKRTEEPTSITQSLFQELRGKFQVETFKRKTTFTISPEILVQAIPFLNNPNYRIVVIQDNSMNYF